MHDFTLFPAQASTFATQVDLIFFVLLALSACFGVGTAVVLSTSP